tara:strand:+ start:7661 stop:7924 length:264 start_codon:yes stop_codon:yes gene_type:complete
MELDESEVMICELAKDSIRECISYGYYDDALHTLSLFMEDSPDMGFSIFQDLMGFWQECYDGIFNEPLGMRKVIVMTPPEKKEEIVE